MAKYWCLYIYTTPVCGGIKAVKLNKIKIQCEKENSHLKKKKNINNKKYIMMCVNLF